MNALFASGHAVDIVLAVMGIEIAALIAAKRPAITTILAFAPGILILLGLRAALVGEMWPWIAAALAATFPVHLLELHRRGLMSAPVASITTLASTSDKQ